MGNQTVPSFMLASQGSTYAVANTSCRIWTNESGNAELCGPLRSVPRGLSLIVVWLQVGSLAVACPSRGMGHIVGGSIVVVILI